MLKLTKYSWLTAAITLIVGFMILHVGGVDYGGAFFFVFPMVVGFTIGTHPKRQRNLISIALAGLIFFGFLLAGALEGLVCVAMASPIFFVMMLLGWAVRRHVLLDMPKPERSIKDHLVVTVLPLLVLVFADRVETWIMPPPEVVTIENEILLDYDAGLVFDMVKQMDKLDAEPTLGIWLGLPAPLHCKLAADTVGAHRVCYFDNGVITAEITRFERGKVLEMDVIDYTLTGREWFQFVDATYTFEEAGKQTRLVRTSAYKSSLRPRWYWEPLETWGIGEEHEFVLASLEKNLREAVN